MAIPAGKTPISYLQEYCTKKGLTPEYELLSHEGAVHEPTFVMRVKVADSTADGKSTSKKKAKHSAARAVLSILLGMQNGQETENEGAEEAVIKEEKGVGNPVGELQEFTQKHLMKPPIYSFDSEQGQPHDRKFFCTIKLGKQVEKGEGRSKRTAKRNAAAAMLVHIKNASGEDGDQLLKLKAEPESDEELPVSKDSSSPQKKKKEEQTDLLTPQQSKQLQLFYENMMQSVGKQLKSACVPAPATNYCQMLQEIADTHRFEVALFEVQERTTLGHFQTILKLTTNPVTVCHGYGTTVEDSRASAAHNALQYLRILMKP